VAPLGGGEVLFCCPTRQKLRPVQFTEAGKVRRIRGVAYPFWSIVAWSMKRLRIYMYCTTFPYKTAVLLQENCDVSVNFE